MERAYFIRDGRVVWIKTASAQPMSSSIEELTALKNLPGVKNAPRSILKGLPKNTSAAPTPFVVTPSSSGV